MFNRKECGLHHPGNVVPSCKSCNKRTRDKESKEYVGWVKHLETKCDSSEEFKIRKEKNNIAYKFRKLSKINSRRKKCP